MPASTRSWRRKKSGFGRGVDVRGSAAQVWEELLFVQSLLARVEADFFEGELIIGGDRFHGVPVFPRYGEDGVTEFA